MAEGLLRQLLGDRGTAASVDSAGVLPGGMPATANAIEVLADLGIDISGHRSRTLSDPEVHLADADLVLAMERRHLQEAVLAVPDVRSRAFTLVDLVRRAEAAEPRRDDEDLRRWASRLAADRTPADLLGVGDDSIDDPFGLSRANYEDTVRLLYDLLNRFLDRAWPGTAEAAPRATEGAA